MPRRNLHLLILIVVVSLACRFRADRYGQTLTFAMGQIDRRYLEEVDRAELFQGAMQGMVDCLADDYSAFITPSAVNEFQQSLDQKFCGVGMEVSLDPETRQLTVMSPLVGTPAYEAGIRAGDRILKIDGQSTQGPSLKDAVGRMQGEPGEPVVLSVLHPGEEEPVDIEIVRAVIRVDTVAGDTRNADGSWNYFLEGHPDIGYLRINAFGERTADEMRRAMGQLDSEGLKGLILDLRNDPGGLLTAAIEVCDLFIDSGVIVSTRRRDGRIRDRYEATGAAAFGDFPMAVLVNQYSASASEIVAACLQDHGRAIVVGQRSWGKGTVQEIIELGPGQGILKLTTASYWRPSGKNIHRTSDADEDDDWGVIPDEGYQVIVEGEDLTELLRRRMQRDVFKPAEEGDTENAAPREPLEDPQLDKAIEYVRRAIDEAEEP